MIIDWYVSDNIGRQYLSMLSHQLRTETDKILPNFWRITRMECQNNITVAPQGNFAFPAITTTILKETHWKEVVSKSRNFHEKLRSNAHHSDKRTMVTEPGCLKR